uniref:cysteine--tRNA ligase n=1 Tax=Oryza nivara TaxID=4536 RepID=A0A0E0ISZ0_ORYNI
MAEEGRSVGEEEPRGKRPAAELRLFDTRTKAAVPFRPRVEGKVAITSAASPRTTTATSATPAPTSPSTYLKYLGYEVNYVRNFTGIDDKIIKRANEAGEDALSLSSRFIDEFHRDMYELQCLPPTHEPRVTKHIEQIIDLITKIMDNGKAYTIEGDVYFSVDNFPDYLSLSGRKVDQNRPGTRVAVDARKRNPADFALWKSAKEGEPSWESPWGRGRPGWHIECSAMSAHYLGNIFDIHGGGKDLIFPHHENELAQSQAAYPESEIISLYHPMALRLFLMRTHYRSDVNHSDTALQFASGRLYYIYQTLHDGEETVSLYGEHKLENSIPADDQKLIEENHSNFLEKMSDDLHTTAALDHLMKLQQKLEHQKKKQSQKQQQQQQKKPEDYIQALVALQNEVTDKLSILGLMPMSSLAEALKQLKDKALKRAGMTAEQLQQMIEQRTLARKNKDFAESDRIRTELSALGIALMDEPTGTLWRPSEPELAEGS